ncbi:hypothetical protein [Burkholderia vietnamiensis]|uniref:hypothetical protein n=1 Tax=Burkholderia vietnamiensis TaxID=60552 RepID=UPI00158DBB7B|nr:hypothetical protein [Burkholderia vietnamiensis]
MKICYLTGKELKTKGDGASEDDSESLEHVIPNALGGKLKSRDILSHKANQELNNLIDKEFVKIFESFSLRLGLDKDRPTTPSMRSFHDDYEVDVVFKNDRYFPRKPFFDPDKKIIYAATTKIGENYKNHLLENGKITKSDCVEIFDDMAGNIDLKFSLDNKIFKQGFAKIGSAFAAIKGVSRENMKSVIDIGAEKFRDKILVVPSIPASNRELTFEMKAPTSPLYPVHGLVLSGSKAERLLYCHVELFSAFQWYVILDDDYDGEDVYYTYANRLSDGSEIDLSEYLDSVLPEKESALLATSYKRISSRKLLEFAREYGKPWVTKYTHFKFNSLAAYSNYVFLRRKAEMLGLQ